ncbi:MAG: HAD hydrolase family protein [Magnetococcales bacterium]|nr:HAD hydrolase family protein [Magnetococcales bacterium]
MVALDVDGVLTDGGIYLDNAGVESKRFYVRDGLGIRMLREAGLSVGLLTARHSPLVAQRAKELSLSFVHQGIKDKWSCLQEELAKAHLDPVHCAYMGDDLIDLKVLQKVGLSTAPGDADPEVCRRVHWVAGAWGGRGAVRELAENILRTQNRWDNILSALLQEPFSPQEQ